MANPSNPDEETHKDDEKESSMKELKQSSMFADKGYVKRHHSKMEFSGYWYDEK